MRWLSWISAWTLVLSTGARADDETRLLRFPAIHRDQIVFTYAGDLYTVPAAGGVARRLTSDIGFEMFPRFSPDGKQIAFTGQYDGNTEVYLIPSEGGVPKRLTYTATLERDAVSDRMGPNNIVLTWTPTGNGVVFRGRGQEFNAFKGRLLIAPLDADLPERIPLPRGGSCSYSPDGKRLAFNRIFREFRTWKRYRGGLADDIWIYDFETKKTDRLTDHPASDLFPMWADNRIYFLSDREASGRMNLYVRDLAGKEDRKLTDFQDFDIKFPSIGPGGIVFEMGGSIHHHDLATGQTRRVPIRVIDDKVVSRAGLVPLAERIADAELGPDGKRALFAARGDLFTVPAEKGPTRNLTQSPGVHDRDPCWSPDGKHIAAISEIQGENELVLFAPNKAGPPTPLTTAADTYYYSPRWSPDSKKLLWSDKKLRLRYVDIESKKVTLVAQGKNWEIRDYAWSPDSQWIAYGQNELESLSRIYLFSLRDEKTIPATDGWYASARPAFSSDGKLLFFVSARDFKPTYSQVEWNHAYTDMERIFFITLAKEAASPFAPESDEVAIKAEAKLEGKEDKEKKKGDKADKKPAPVRVDGEGLMQRIAALPIKPAHYGSLVSVGDRVFYARGEEGGSGGTIASYDLKKKKETEHGHYSSFTISADGKKFLVAQKNSYAILDLPAGPIEMKEKLDLSGLETRLDRQAEWRQIFAESWRQMRDFFYVANLHGVDWGAIRKKYEPLLEHVAHRADLTYLIGEMIGELNAGHTYVGGGDLPEVKRIPLGLLGAEIQRDPKSKAIRIRKILRGENWTKAGRSPLTEIGVQVREGDYILAIDGQPTAGLANPYLPLIHKAGKQVTLRVHDSPDDQGARDVVIVPIADEHPLYYQTWVRENVEKVDRLSGGKVGYLHIPDMMSEGLNEFAKQFYPQLRRPALLIDCRGNGGGNVSPMIIERLRREIAMFSVARNAAVTTNPSGLHFGPKALLIDEFSASDGDLVAYRFRHYHLGKLIGKRTWGGVVGIRGTLPLLDGGYLNKPEFAPFDVTGKNWIIEGQGVEPDIVVDNDPAKEFAGTDEQLERGVAQLLEELKVNEPKIPAAPPPAPRK